MGAPKTPKNKQNGNIMGAHQIKRAQGKFFVKGAPFIQYFRVILLNYGAIKQY